MSFDFSELEPVYNHDNRELIAPQEVFATSIAQPRYISSRLDQFYPAVLLDCEKMTPIYLDGTFSKSCPDSHAAP